MASDAAAMGVPVRDAATVMLVRDRSDGPGFEVFMLRRNLNSDFVGGAYVFPGGGVDVTDRAADLEPFCGGWTDDAASAVLGIAQGGLAFWVAAVRECFEEAGVLLARDRTGAVMSFADDATASRFEGHRARLNAGTTTLIDLCREEQLVLDVGAMHYFAHWITPLGAPRRYDTRFFIGAAPTEQVPLHDDREVIANLWITPEEALERNAAGDYELIMPTFKNLEALARFDSSAAVLDVARTMSGIPAMLPRIGRGPDGVRILLPGDDGYEEAATGALRPGETVPRGAGTARAGTDRAGTGRAATGQVGTDRAGTGEVGTGEVGTGEVGTGEVGTGEVGTGEVGTDRAGTGEVGTDRAETGEVGTGRAGTGRAGTGSAHG